MIFVFYYYLLKHGRLAIYNEQSRPAALYLHFL